MTDPGPQVPPDQCVRCRSPLTDWGIHRFRTEGSSGTSKLLFGEWAELGEQMLPFHLRYCVVCGQVDVRLPSPHEQAGRGEARWGS